MILIFGAVLGLISVAFGAYAEHGLRGSITEDQMRSLMTALRYNQVNSIVISVIGMALLGGGKLANIAALKWSGLLFIIGTMLFCFSIYVSVTFDVPSLLKIAPTGGTTMMFAWILLILVGLTGRKRVLDKKE